jgi:hypothetical protein
VHLSNFPGRGEEVPAARDGHRFVPPPITFSLDDFLPVALLYIAADGGSFAARGALSVIDP